MSDPMTKLEIEDVLASIRRLVSEEMRPVVRQPAASDTGQGAGRLVLTPALRVADEMPEDADPAPESAAEPLAEPLDEPSDEPGDETTAEGAADLADDIEEEAADAIREEAAAPAAAEEAAGDWQPEAEAEGASGEEADWQPEAAPPLASPFAPPNPEAIEATIAELEAAVAARGEDWEPDGTEAPAASEKSPSFGGAARFIHRTIHRAEAKPQPIPETAPMPEVAVEPTPQPAADPDEAVAWEDVTPEPAAPEAKAAPDPKADPKAGHGGGGDTPFFDPEDGEGFLDEETLRDLVREIIRQELQGTLGERITRNVRKLVRSEVSRALASRDFQ